MLKIEIRWSQMIHKLPPISTKQGEFPWALERVIMEILGEVMEWQRAWRQAGTRRQDVTNLHFSWVVDILVTTHTDMDHHMEDTCKVLSLQTTTVHLIHMCLLINQLWLGTLLHFLLICLSNHLSLGCLILGRLQVMVRTTLHLLKQLEFTSREYPRMGVLSRHKWHKDQLILKMCIGWMFLWEVIKINFSYLTLVLCMIKQEVWRMGIWDI